MKRKLGTFILVLAATIITASFVGGSYSKYVTPINVDFWGPAHPEYLTGFILSFLFFGSLLPWALLKENKIKRLLKYTLPFLIMMLLLQALEEFIIGLAFIFVGWMLGWGILRVKQSLQKNRVY